MSSPVPPKEPHSKGQEGHERKQEPDDHKQALTDVDDGNGASPEPTKETREILRDCEVGALRQAEVHGRQCDLLAQNSETALLRLDLGLPLRELGLHRHDVGSRSRLREQRAQTIRARLRGLQATLDIDDLRRDALRLDIPLKLATQAGQSRHGLVELVGRHADGHRGVFTGVRLRSEHEPATSLGDRRGRVGGLRYRCRPITSVAV